MDLVVDANILFAALIKKGTTAELLYLDELHLYAPEFLLDEFDKYRDLIMNKTARSSDEFDKVLEALSHRIYFVPREELLPIMDTAKKISPDPNDAVYFAVALRVGAAIWTNDKRLLSQEQVPIYSTSDLIEKFSSKL